MDYLIGNGVYPTQDEPAMGARVPRARVRSSGALTAGHDLGQILEPERVHPLVWGTTPG